MMIEKLSAINGALENKMGIAFFDIESVATENEFLEEAAELLGRPEIIEITRKGMQGKIDWKQGLLERIELLKGTPRKKMDKCSCRMRLRKGIGRLTGMLRSMGYAVIAISGGFTVFEHMLKDRKGNNLFDLVIANELEFDGQDRLTGVKVNVDDKGNIAMRIIEEWAAMKKEKPFTIALGDSKNDKGMLEIADLAIGINPNLAIEDCCDYKLYCRTFLPAIKLIKALGITGNIPSTRPIRKFHFAPGPIEMRKAVRKELARQTVYHRSKKFEQLYGQTCSNARKFFGIPESKEVAVVPFASTPATEMLLASFANGKKVLSLANGVFGKRIGELAQRHCEAEMIYRWAEKIDEEWIGQDKLDNCQWITIVSNETSTAIMNDYASVVNRTRENKKRTLVDYVSCAGGCKIDSENPDAIVIGVQKCIGAHPGVTIIAWERGLMDELSNAETTKKAPHVLDIKNYFRDGKFRIPFTPAMNCYAALNAALMRMLEEGSENGFNRHDRFKRIYGEILESAGMPMMDCANSPTVLAVEIGKLGDKELEAIKNLAILGQGKGEWKDKVLRIGVMDPDAGKAMELAAAMDVALGKKGSLISETAKQLEV